MIRSDRAEANAAANALPAPSMTLAPGAMPLTIQGSGLSGFGLSGPVNPETAGKEAGEKVGEGVKDGIKAKAPEVVDQAQSLFDALSRIFKQGIAIPLQMSFEGGGSGGGGSGLIQRASFNPGGSGGSGSFGGGGYAGGGGIPGTGGGGGLGSGGGGGAGVAHARGVLARANPEMVAYIRAAAVRNGIDPEIALRIAASEGLGGSVPGVRMTPGDKGTSFGPYQLHYGGRGSLGTEYTRATGHHAGDPRYWQEQIDFALRYAGRNRTWAPWFRRGPAGVGTHEGFGYKGAPVAMPKGGGSRDASALDPHLVKGLDGKEGLDLGNGTMRMPDGSIRSITHGPPKPFDPPAVPDAPKASLGRSSSDAMQAAADRMHEAAGRLEDATIRNHTTIELTGSGRDAARVKRMRSHSDGPVRGNLGYSMPQTEIG